MSSAISSMRRVTGLAERGTCAIFLTAASLRSSRQMSLEADRINSSPMVNGLLALAIRLATKYDALGALAFVDVVALSNCFYPSCSCFFLSKYSFKILTHSTLLMQGACLQVAKQFWRLHSLISEPVAAYYAEHAWCAGITCHDKSIFEVGLVLSVKCSFLFLGSRKLFFRLLTGPFPLRKETFKRHLSFTHFGSLWV